MKRLLIAACLGLVGAQSLVAQSPPRLVPASGVARDAAGNLHSGSVAVTFAIYETQDGGDPLWKETQSLTLDAAGQYSTLLGMTSKEGLPQELFSESAARWLAVSIDGGPEGPRSFWASVPYALKAADAETVGGLPAEAFVVNGAYRKGADAPALPKADSDGLPAGAAVNDDPTGNLVATDSLCVGIDCPSSPTYSDTTILLMENNTRIKFDDTSTTGSFPNNDWEIEANSNLNGGASYLGINDCGVSSQGGCADDLVFAIEAGVRANALYVESDGDIGIGTADPAVDIHLVTGNTPTLRLDQDASSGFTPQVWDVAGNEANFFVRDVTNGSRLPFRIQPNAPTNTLVLEGTTGDVGIGTSAPESALHVNRTAGAFANMMELRNNSGVGFILNNTAANGGAGSRVFMSVNNPGSNFTLNFDDGDGPELAVSSSGALTGVTSCTGCAAPSDRALKENFAAVDRRAVLKGLLGLDVSTWNYKTISPGERHIGPMSQDFFAAFAVGRDVTLSPVDTFGVTTAAIQALSDQTTEANKALSDQVAELQQLVAALKAELEQLKKSR